ncbi:SH3 domain-binding protein 2 isoform X2 [Oncorhynchus mykiss]|uniref:SH3 domain-binding protein 2 isoform X2 n=1 Tax=Oncorhynchus mykiss TaxID=8022 RepID=UPI000B4F2692|nr:SH3 domain-binding protein 2 isoform X2 [Oncorhynchus mykiss]
MDVSVRENMLFLLASEPSVRMCWERNSTNMSSAEIYWPVPMRAIGAQNLLTMPGGVCHSGYLHKKGGSQFSLMKWPLRYIIIHRGCVYYFKSSTSPAPQGAFSLNGYNRVMRAAEETTSNNVFPFKIVHFSSKKHRTYCFSAANEEERRKWMRNLRKEIDHYNDRMDSHIPNDSESDTDSFYGSIESPMDITYARDDPGDNYMLEDEEDDEDEDDYEKPDSPPTYTGRLTVPPPSYHPPPLPCQFRQESKSGFCKGLPQPAPAPVPVPNRTLSSPLPKKMSPVLPRPKLGEVGHNQHGHMDIPNKDSPERSVRGPKTPLPTPIASLQKQMMMAKTSISTLPVGDHRDKKPHVPVTLKSPATLPICINLERQMGLNPRPPGYHGNTPSHIPSVRNYCHSTRSTPDLPPQASPALNHTPGQYKPPLLAKSPCPATMPKQPRGSAQSSPDGHSFRTSVDEVPASLRKNRGPSKDIDDDSDEDYENVQLPDSVFVDITETSSVEKLFMESSSSPQDGLYCFRNSGSKTSKVLVVWDVDLCKARNYRLFEEDSRVFLEFEMTFSSLSALVEHYYSHPLPNHDSLCLQQPYGYIMPR